MNKIKNIFSITMHYILFIIHFFYIELCVYGCIFKGANILAAILLAILPLTCAILNFIIGFKKITGHTVHSLLSAINYLLSAIITIPVLYAEVVIIVFLLGLMTPLAGR